MRLNKISGLIIALSVILIAFLFYGYAAFGQYGFSSVIQRGITHWVKVSNDDPELPLAIKLALRENPPSVVSGNYEWKNAAPGLDVAVLPVLAEGVEGGRILLSRMDPVDFQFVVRDQPSGFRSPEAWIKNLGASVVINGSYYGHRGLPDTPFIEDGTVLGPADYQAEQGAFMIKSDKPSIVDLAVQHWQDAFAGARDALVSYPLLVSPNGQEHPIKPSRWLANRSFVAQDQDGKVIFGTTTGGFFSLDRLAGFLRTSPLALQSALNLDGGPVASQSVNDHGFIRDFQGHWELQVASSGQTTLLTWPWGRWGLPIVIAAVRKDKAN